jgi:DNA-binding MarR family transcriptional regulator
MVQKKEEIDLQYICKLLANTYLIRIGVFSDMFNRFIDIELKGKINWMKIFTLTVLATREGMVTPGMLGKTMLRSKNSMSKLIDMLVEEKLIRRTKNKSDRRIIQIQITNKGSEYLQKSLNYISPVENKLEKYLSPDDFSTLIMLERTLRKNIMENLTSKI